MVYDKSDRWLYRPLSYRTERLCTRTLCDKSEIRPFVVKESTNSAARSVSISHHSDGVSVHFLFYSIKFDFNFTCKKNLFTIEKLL